MQIRDNLKSSIHYVAAWFHQAWLRCVQAATQLRGGRFRQCLWFPQKCSSAFEKHLRGGSQLMSAGNEQQVYIWQKPRQTGTEQIELDLDAAMPSRVRTSVWSFSSVTWSSFSWILCESFMSVLYWLTERHTNVPFPYYYWTGILLLLVLLILLNIMPLSRNLFVFFSWNDLYALYTRWLRTAELLPSGIFLKFPWATQNLHEFGYLQV